MENLINYLEYKLASHNFSLQKLEQNTKPKDNFIYYNIEGDVLFLYPDPDKFNIVKNILISPDTTIDQDKNGDINLENFDVHFCEETYFKICKTK